MDIEGLEKFENVSENKEKKEIKTFDIDLDFLSDISLYLNVEVGKTKKLFIEILKLKEGDIISLDKSTEDYLDIYLNGSPFAIGELVVVNEKYSVRLVDIV